MDRSNSAIHPPLMTATRLLPPAYLLPAWSHHQLVLFSSRIPLCSQRKQFSELAAKRQGDYVQTPTNNRPETIDVPDVHALQRRRVVHSTALRRQIRFEKGNDEIRRRLEEQRNGLVRSSPNKADQAGEEEMIARYVSRQKLVSSNTRAAQSSAQALTSRSQTSRMYNQVRQTEENVKRPMHRENKRQAARGSDTHVSSGSELYPAYKVAQNLDPEESSEGAEISNNDASDGVLSSTSNASSDPGFLAAAGPSERVNLQRMNKAKPSNPSEKSLLEELFPEEAAKQKPVKEVRDAPQPRYMEPQHLPLSSVDNSFDDDVSDQARLLLTRNVATITNNPAKLVPAILVLENAMPNLLAADFKRVSPRGKHIEQWKSRFHPAAIIPARTSRTGECTGKYYLIFNNVVHAKSWRSRVELLHRTVRKHAATSLLAPIVPKKGFFTEGVDIGETLREYSIFSVGVDPLMRLHSNPQADPNIKDELDMIIRRIQPSKSIFQAGRSVLLWIEGWTFGTDENIRKMLTIDGRERNQPWGDWGNEESFEGYRNQIPLVRSKDSDSANSSQKTPRKWLITLRDEAEARRFVRSWHLRPFPGWLHFKKDTHDEPWPLIRTELVW